MTNQPALVAITRLCQGGGAGKADNGHYVTQETALMLPIVTQSIGEVRRRIDTILNEALRKRLFNVVLFG